MKFGKMKYLVALVLIMAVMLFAAGCQSSTPAPAPAPEPAPAPASTEPAPAAATEPTPEPKDFSGTFVSISTTPSGGGWYIHAGAIANVWQENINGLTATAQTSSGIMENIELLQGGRVEMAFLNPDMVYQAQNSIMNYEGKPPLTNIRRLFNLIPAPMHVVVAKNSGIQSVDDFVGKKIGVGANDLSAVTLYARILLEIYGIDESQVTLAYFSRQERADALADGAIDVFLEQMNPNSAMVIELLETHGAYFISVPKDKQDAILAKYPFYGNLPVTQEMYPVPAEVDGLGTFSFAACLDTLDEDLVYELTKVYIEHLDEIGVAYSPAAGMTGEASCTPNLLPLHPGAERYYKEQGLL